jgi:arginine deiminase
MKTGTRFTMSIVLRGIAFFFAFLLLSSSMALARQDLSATVQAGARAEWDPAKMVLMHTPGEEILLGVVHPDAALFEKPFSLEEARRQHLDYIALLEQEGAVVHTVVQTLLAGTIDEDGRTLQGPALNELREFAARFLVYDTARLAPEVRKRQEQYKHEVLAALSPTELVAIILQQPTVHLHPTNTNTGFSATYKSSPVMNLYFCRDQVITTAKGVVVARMNSPQRFVETEIIKFVLGKLGIEPIYEVTGKGRLEGGDYFSAGDIAFIGQGLRTNAEGVRQLLDNQVFGLPRVAVVKDFWEDQEEMHLDTFFNIINPKLAALVDLRMRLPGREPDPMMVPLVDLYELQDGVYVKTMTDRNFQDFMEQDLGYTLIPASREDQIRYGLNFLTVHSDRILAIDGVSETYKQRLRDHGVDATWMDFGALTSGYGAAHCTTQVLVREAKP